MKLWEWTWIKGHPALVTVSEREASIRRAFEIASKIPGARVDDTDGTVTGSEGALLACLAEADQPTPSGRGWNIMPRHSEKAWHQLPLYQQFGAAFTYERIDQGVMINDDVGLGKTVQALAAASVKKFDDHMKLIICPAFVRGQWEEEIKRWVGKFRGGREAVTHVIYPQSDKRSRKPMADDTEYVICYYMDAEKAIDLIGYNRYLFIADEMHNLRNVKAKRMDQMRAATLLAAGRVGLTASPLYNDATGVWPMYDLISPGHWGTRYSFLKRYAGAVEGEYGLEIGGLTHVEELNKRRGLHGFRRVKEDVWEQLPFSAKYQTIWLQPPPGNGDSLKGAIMGGQAGNQAHLERVSLHKTGAVAAQVASDNEAGIPSITFTWLKLQARQLAAMLPGSLLITGDSTSSSKRREVINSYVNKCKALKRTPHVIATMDALSESVNAQWAKIVNFAAVDYTPDKIHQCIGRAVRMGQEGQVIVRFFACRNTIDEHCCNVVLTKLNEQSKMDGRREKSKADLKEALSPPGVREALATMYERFQRQEKQQ